MSLFDRQSLCLITVARTGLILVRNNFQLGLEFTSLLIKADKALDSALRDWPTENDRGVEMWVKAKISRWLRSQPAARAEWEIVNFLALSIVALTDMHERVVEMRRKQRDKTEMRQKQIDLLDPVFRPTQEVLDFIAPNGIDYTAMAAADFLLKKLYSILELEVK